MAGDYPTQKPQEIVMSDGKGEQPQGDDLIVKTKKEIMELQDAVVLKGKGNSEDGLKLRARLAELERKLISLEKSRDSSLVSEEEVLVRHKQLNNERLITGVTSDFSNLIRLIVEKNIEIVESGGRIYSPQQLRELLFRVEEETLKPENLPEACGLRETAKNLIKLRQLRKEMRGI